MFPRSLIPHDEWLWARQGILCPECEIREHWPGSGRVAGIGFSQDSEAVHIVRASGEVQSWDFLAEGESRILLLPWQVRVATPVSGGQSFAAVDPKGSLVLLDADARKEVARWRGGKDQFAVRVAMTPDGARFVAQFAKEVVVYDAPRGGVVGRLVFHGHRGDRGRYPSPLGISPDGRLLSAGHYPERSHVEVWDIALKRKLFHVEGHGVAISPTAFSPDGRTLAAGLRNDAEDPEDPTVIQIWEIASGKVRLELRRLGCEPTNLAYSPCGRVLAAVYRGDPAVYVWDVTSGRLVTELRGHSEGISVLAFSPDGRRLAVGGLAGTVHVWDERVYCAGPPLRAGPSASRLPALWEALGSGKPSAAHWAIAELIDMGAPAARYLRERLPRVPPAELAKVKGFRKRLGSPNFAEREQASADLEKQGEAAERLLRAILAADSTTEVRRRVEVLLDKLHSLTGPRVRTTRALEVLERMNSPASRAALRELAGGTAQTWVTEEARACLGRLARRPPAAALVKD